MKPSWLHYMRNWNIINYLFAFILYASAQYWFQQLVKLSWDVSAHPSLLWHDFFVVLPVKRQKVTLCLMVVLRKIGTWKLQVGKRKLACYIYNNVKKKKGKKSKNKTNKRNFKWFFDSTLKLPPNGFSILVFSLKCKLKIGK